jgi:hypothetical protein
VHSSSPTFLGFFYVFSFSLSRPFRRTFDNQHHIGEDNVGEWASLCESVHQAGGKMSAQLHHPGLFTMSKTGTPMGPSFFWLPSKLAWPKTMNADDLKEVKDQFIEAARMCVEAGFDCLELHCGHGYLLSQFLTPMINRRWDKYGGSPEGRARYPREIMEGIRALVGKDFPILIKMNVDDGVSWGGLHLDQALRIAKVFADAGADGIIPSFGYTSLNGFGMLRGNVPLEKMVEALPNGSKMIAKYAGKFVVPSIEFESLFLRTDAKVSLIFLSFRGFAQLRVSSLLHSCRPFVMHIYRASSCFVFCPPFPPGFRSRRARHTNQNNIHRRRGFNVGYRGGSRRRLQCSAARAASHSGTVFR